MIVKRLLFEWSKEISADLAGVPASQIAKATGISIQSVKNYMSLSGQETFDPEVIAKINAYRDDYLRLASSFCRQKPAELLQASMQ